MTSIVQLMASGLVSPQNAGREAQALFQNVDQTESTTIRLKTDKEGAAAVEFDLLAYFAPGMALMFLMYTVSYGGRSILAERAQGTLPRLMISPTQTVQVLGGKVLGIFFMGVAQVGILILASAIFFQVKWGDPLGVIALILAAVFGAAGWGMLITAIARTTAQVSNTGSAVMLIFGILGGSFINLEQFPPFMQTISKITPNAWGLDGFTTLALGGTLKNLTEPISALLIMGQSCLGFRLCCSIAMGWCRNEKNFRHRMEGRHHPICQFSGVAILHHPAHCIHVPTCRAEHLQGMMTTVFPYSLSMKRKPRSRNRSSGNSKNQQRYTPRL